MELSGFLGPVRLKSGRTVKAILGTEAESGCKLLYSRGRLVPGEKFVYGGALYRVEGLARREGNLRVYHVRAVLKAAQAAVH